MLAFLAALNARRCSRRPLFGVDVRAAVSVSPPALTVHRLAANPGRYLEFPNALAELVVSFENRCEKAQPLVETFMFAIPRARAPRPKPWCSHPGVSEQLASERREVMLTQAVAPLLTPLRQAIVRRQLFFPDRRLLQVREARRFLGRVLCFMLRLALPRVLLKVLEMACLGKGRGK